MTTLNQFAGEGAVTAGSLLALEEECRRHNTLDLVTVIREAQVAASSNPIIMTSLRAQCDAYASKWGDASPLQPPLQDQARLASVRRNTSEYMSQLACFLGAEEEPRSSSRSEPSRQQLLYYPFGGIDVVSALGLAPSAVHCVVFASAEPFVGGTREEGRGRGGGGGGAQGLSSDLGKLLGGGSSFLWKGGGSTMFDSHDDFDQLHDELGLGGVGALALLRLLGPAGRDVDFVSFFDLDEAGNIALVPPHLASACQHAVIGVSSGASGGGNDGDGGGTAAEEEEEEEGVEGGSGSRCLLFFIRHDTRLADAAVDEFCKRLHPDILLIKAAPDTLWQIGGEGRDEGEGETQAGRSNAPSGDANGAEEAHCRCVNRALAPGARCDAIVVTDSSQANPTAPPCIFKDADAVMGVVFQSLAPPPAQGAAGERSHGKSDAAPCTYEKFGYGDSIFRSTGRNLRLWGSGSAESHLRGGTPSHSH